MNIYLKLNCFNQNSINLQNKTYMNKSIYYEYLWNELVQNGDKYKVPSQEPFKYKESTKNLYLLEGVKILFKIEVLDWKNLNNPLIMYSAESTI